MVRSFKQAWYLLPWQHWPRSVPQPCPWQGRIYRSTSTHRVHQQFLTTETEEHIQLNETGVQKIGGAGGKTEDLKWPFGSAMAECSPACFASQPRGAPIASAHLTDVPVEEKRARIKHNCTCGSWEKHSKNSEEGLPLAVVWQRVVEHQLFGVPHEAVLCGDRTGEESPGASTAAGALQLLSAEGLLPRAIPRDEHQPVCGGAGRNHSCPIFLKSCTHKFYFPNKFYRRWGRGKSDGWDTNVMHLVTTEDPTPSLHTWRMALIPPQTSIRQEGLSLTAGMQGIN